MKHALRCAGLAAAVCWLTAVAPPEARAADFSLAFDTNGSLFDNTGTTTFSDNESFVGSLSVSFAPNSFVSSPTVSDGASVTLGTFTVNITGVYTNTVSQPFTLMVNQTDPISGTNTQSAQLSGFIFLGGGNIYLDLGDSNSISFNVPAGGPPNVTYTLQNLQTIGGIFNRDPGNLDLGNGGTTDLVATVTSHGPFAAAPEPSTIALALSGIGTVGLVGLRRRRISKATA